MVGENLCVSYMEVAFEQWTERNTFLSRLHRNFRRYEENNIKDNMSAYCMSAKVILKLGGTASDSS